MNSDENDEASPVLVLMQMMVEGLGPMEEMARGLRTRMVENDWTEATADHVGGTLMAAMITKMFE